MAPEIFKKTGHGKPVDIWAIGVITYFLLCGYTPFDRDSNLEEMQAILVADYSFTPIEYWRGVSLQAREFIKRCLTIDPTQRMTAHEALSHPFVAGLTTGREGNTEKGSDLLPVIKKNFNARRTLHAAIDTVRAINKLREGYGGMMDGVTSENPAAGAAPLPSHQYKTGGTADSGVGGMGDAAQTDSGYVTGTGQLGQGAYDSQGDAQMGGVERFSGQGQTEAQIEAQTRKIAETTKGLWSNGRRTNEEQEK
ncbi:putative Calcium/calmodulin-dependent protein kinase type I [Glarea lozoyensis 74030]|uniref:Putative Calcium/calmodulin-dependent protein kinase type I n=1 Tax=Glarea lozoyensis (strain ATCC 74030 / MF5533) TaxID=1104152 RepID=H0EJA9_GLAL7|nr:putative Calcium/calmodulin-dependent protein kinase type I [Glarea lozoyensis 74030]